MRRIKKPIKAVKFYVRGLIGSWLCVFAKSHFAPLVGRAALSLSAYPPVAYSPAIERHTKTPTNYRPIDKRPMFLTSRSLIVLFGLATSCSVFSGSAGVTVDQILRRMGAAMQENNFRGEFTYQHGSSGAMEALEIVHAIINGVEYEKINHLNGPEREFLLLGANMDCLSPGRKFLRGGTVAERDERKVNLDRYYTARFIGDDRVAGREVSILKITPKDNFRYGYTLGVDAETGLLIKSLVTTSQKVVLERIQFVSLDLDQNLTSEHFAIDTANTRQQVLQSDNCNKLQNDSESSPWQPKWIPGGFILAEYNYSEDDGHMETYTDGLASFSVFVNDRQSLQLGQPVWRGATVAMMNVLPKANENNHLYVTIVGEIPVETARRISLSISDTLR